jgi:hypothetical protein
MNSSKKINKKVISIVGVLLLIVGVGAFVKTRSKTEEVAEKPKLKKTKITEPLNIIEVSERPYIVISPNSDGRNITIAVESVKKDALAVDYELEYQSGSLLQGVFGSMELVKLPTSTKQLLGSCSAGGACTYHTDVTGGHLTTRFNGEEKYALKSEWKYIENTESEDALSSRDAKFQISSEKLEGVKLAVVFNTPGYPEKLSKTLVSDVYSLQTVPAVTGTATLTMRAKEEGELMIMGWNGEEWTEFEGKVDGKSITAEVELMELYVVVTP